MGLPVIARPQLQVRDSESSRTLYQNQITQQILSTQRSASFAGVRLQGQAEDASGRQSHGAAGNACEYI